LSKENGILQTKLHAIVKGRRRITPDIAAKLAGILETLPNSGLNRSMILT
jgi:plasmid maintenance system antidote protein VapI